MTHTHTHTHSFRGRIARSVDRRIGSEIDHYDVGKTGFECEMRIRTGPTVRIGF